MTAGALQTGETFDAELTIEYNYLLTREDIFRYIMSPMEWKPSWLPDEFRMLNTTENDPDVHMLPPQVRITDKDVRAADGAAQQCSCSWRGAPDASTCRAQLLSGSSMRADTLSLVVTVVRTLRSRRRRLGRAT